MLVSLVLLAQSLSVDIHAHPSRFHRANVSRIEALQARGYSPGEIEKVMGENFVRVWREVTR